MQENAAGRVVMHAGRMSAASCQLRVLTIVAEASIRFIMLVIANPLE